MLCNCLCNGLGASNNPTSLGEEGGFVSGVARADDQERRKQGVELNTPVEVIWRENGRISVYDPSTAWQADLMGFGADNSRAFAMLLAKAKKGE